MRLVWGSPAGKHQSVLGFSWRERTDWIKVHYEENFLNWLTWYTCNTLTMAAHGRGWASDSCSGRRTGHLSTPSLSVKAWRIPEEPLVFNPRQGWGMRVEETEFWCHRQIDVSTKYIYTFWCQRQMYQQEVKAGRQANSPVFPSSLCLQVLPILERVYLFQLMPIGPRDMPLSWLQIQSSSVKLAIFTTTISVTVSWACSENGPYLFGVRELILWLNEYWEDSLGLLGTVKSWPSSLDLPTIFQDVQPTGRGLW